MDLTASFQLLITQRSTHVPGCSQPVHGLCWAGQNLQQLWASYTIKTQVLHSMLQGLDAAPVAAGKDPADAVPVPWGSLQPPVLSQAGSLMEGGRARTYKPLLERPRCEGLESRIQLSLRRGRGRAERAAKRLRTGERPGGSS